MTPGELQKLPVVRISVGRFDPIRREEVTAALQASESSLRHPIGALPGLIAYYVGIDPDTSTITNTSTWQTRDHAMAVSTLGEMADQRGVFERLGVVFEPVANYNTLWEI
ncbi:MAG: hypothetical protein WB239_19010 [Acidimicrobiia bacterium]